MPYRLPTSLVGTSVSRALIPGLAAVVLTACASPDSHPRLDEARSAFEQATAAGASEHAPVALHEAQEALNRAADSFDDGDDEVEIEHYSFIAKNRSEIARERAEQAVNAREMDKLAAERQRLVLEARENQALEAERRAEMAQEEARRAQESAQQAQQESAAMRSRAEQLETELASLQFAAEQRGDELVLTLGNLVFGFDQAELKPGVQRNLEPLVELLQDFPERRIRIEGYTDSVGNEEYNEQLSRERAEAVRVFLVNRGVDGSRIVVEGMGEQLPIASNDTAAGRQMNRRVEVVIAEPGAADTPGDAPGLPGDAAAGGAGQGRAGDEISAAPLDDAAAGDTATAFP